MTISVDDLVPGSKVLARSLPAGFAQYASYGKWMVADHLLVIQAYLMALLDDKFDNLIISMPPRHGKSMFVSTYFPAWYLGKFPNHEIILTSYEATLAGLFGGRVRDLISEFGPDLWGLSVKPNRRSSGDWSLAGVDENGVPVVGGMRSAGIGSGVTGRGANFILIDDPIKDAEQAQSVRYRQRAWDYYMSTLFTRREPGCKQVCVMTRWHEDDLAARLVERADEQEGVEWVVLSLPAICMPEDVAGDPLGRQAGDPLWAERWPANQLSVIRATMSSYWWNSLYQQRPAPPEGNIFKRSWWKFWAPADVIDNLPPLRMPGSTEASEVVPLPTTFSKRAQSWDMTFKGNTDNAYVVGQVWARHEADTFLLDQDRAQRDFPSTITAVRDLTNRWPDVEAKWIEDAANAAATAAVLKDEIPGIVLIPVEGTKEDRANSISAYAESGNVYLPHPIVAPWVEAFIEETAAFPNAKTADQVDCMSQALRKLYTKEERARMVWGKRLHARR